MGQRNQIAKQTFKDVPQEFQMHYSGVVDSVNTLLGYSGTIPMQNNLDVLGNNVQNVANPVQPTDALNLQTAEGKYSPTVVGPALDVGGKNAMPGLTALWMKVNKSSSKGSNANGYWVNINGLLVQFNAAVALGGGDFAVTYPTPFTVIGVPIPVAVFPSGDTGWLSVVTGTATLTGFTIHQNNVTGMAANWVSVGM